MLALRKHEKESFEKLKKEIENLRDEKDQLLAMSGYPKLFRYALYMSILQRYRIYRH